MALIGGCTMAVVYVPYVVVRVGMHAPITGGYLSSVLPVAWAAAALASASVSAWAYRFITIGARTRDARSHPDWVGADDRFTRAYRGRRLLRSARVSGRHGRIWKPADRVRRGRTSGMLRRLSSRPSISSHKRLALPSLE